MILTLKMPLRSNFNILLISILIWEQFLKFRSYFAFLVKFWFWGQIFYRRSTLPLRSNYNLRENSEFVDISTGSNFDSGTEFWFWGHILIWLWNFHFEAKISFWGQISIQRANFKTISNFNSQSKFCYPGHIFLF